MAETRSKLLDTTTMMTLNESNPKRRHPSDPSSSVKDLRLKRVCIDLHTKVESDVQGDAKNSRYGDFNEGIEFDSKQSDIVLQEMKLDDMSNRNLVDVTVEQRTLLSDEVKFENPDKNKVETPLCRRSKLVESSKSVSFKRLLPYLKNLTEDESSGIKICPSYDHSSASEKNMLRDVNTVGGLNEKKAAETLAQMNVRSSLVNKSGISSRLQSRLFGNLNSPSYKRLLPYLNDLAKDNLSNTSASNTQCKLVKIGSTNNTASMVDNVNAPPIKDPILGRESSIFLEIPCTPTEEEVNDGQLNEMSMDIVQSTPLDANMLKNKESFEKRVEEIPLAAEAEARHISEGGDDSCNKMLQSSDVILLTDSSDFELEMLHKSSSSSPAAFNNLSPDKGGTEEAFTPKKGILKKNTRECQGMCMCLECHLHRINAEKAFDFSRKQLSCANEVVEGLLKELSSLRKAMENSYSPLHLDQKQVKSVCQRALKVEEQAVGYMNQMFSDLNNHCKPPGPRVTFSDILEEKVYP